MLFLANFEQLKQSSHKSRLMDSKRQLKVSRLIQKELSQLFLTELRELTGGQMTTISYVKVTPDLREVKVYVSFMLAPNYQEIIKKINDSIGLVRGVLGKKLAKSMRVIPTLEFFYDDTFEYTDKMNDLLDGLDIPKKED